MKRLLFFLLCLFSLTTEAANVGFNITTRGTSPTDLNYTGATFTATSGIFDGSGNLYLTAITGASVASTFPADNRVVRSDGTNRGIQGSGVSIDDSDNISTPGNLTVSGNAAVTGNVTATGNITGSANLTSLNIRTPNYISPRTWQTGASPSFSWLTNNYGINVTADTTFAFADTPTDTNTVRLMRVVAIGDGTHFFTNSANLIAWAPTYPGILMPGTNEFVFKFEGGIVTGYVLDQLVSTDGILAQVNKRMTNILLSAGFSLSGNSLVVDPYQSLVGSPTALTGSGETDIEPFANGSSGGNNSWTDSAINSGPALSFTGDSGASGITEFSTGSVTNGGRYMKKGALSILFGTSIQRFACRFRLPLLSTSADAYKIYLGFGDATIEGTQGDGLCIEYTHAASSGNFTVRGINNTASTGPVDCLVGPTANTWHVIEIVASADAASVIVNLDGVTIKTTAALTLPTGAGRQTGVQFGIYKTGGSVGTNARVLDVDWVATRKAR